LAIKDPNERDIALYGTVVTTPRWSGGKGCGGEPDEGTVESRNSDGWVAADADLWMAAVAKHCQAMLSGSVTAYRGTAAYGLCGLIDPAPAAAWARGLRGAETCRFLPAELMSLIEGRAAVPATSEAAAEPLRASAGRVIMHEPDPAPNWKPLMDALEWADAALGADAWGLMKEWNQSGELPMRGRADGTTQVFQCHWFDYRARWGPAADTEGETPSSDRPRRTRSDPAMANRLAPRPSRSSKDDILWFDQTAATAKRVHVPRRVSNVLVDMTALRRLCTEWRRPNEPGTTAAELDSAPIPNKPGNGGRKMAEAIEAMVAAVDGGRVAFADLRRMKQKELSKVYPNAKRTLLAQARKHALVRLATLGHSDKAAT
jgi:hypothetical protein